MLATSGSSRDERLAIADVLWDVSGMSNADFPSLWLPPSLSCWYCCLSADPMMMPLRDSLSSRSEATPVEEARVFVAVRLMLHMCVLVRGLSVGVIGAGVAVVGVAMVAVVAVEAVVLLVVWVAGVASEGAAGRSKSKQVYESSSGVAVAENITGLLAGWALGLENKACRHTRPP